MSRRFALLHEAISGTMSSFYMARDLQTDKVVGLKILDPRKTAAFEARFKGLNKPCEGEIAAQLKHPHIVETYEYGLTTEGAQYLVMEFLEGPDMNSALAARDPCLEGRRVHFIRQAAEAVAAVHEAGFIHRDICPRNFLLDQQPRGPEADRLRPDGAGHAVVHAAGQPHGHAQLHGPGAGPPPAHRPAARRVRLRRDGL